MHGGKYTPRIIASSAFALTSATTYSLFPAKAGKKWLVLRAWFEVTVGGPDDVGIKLGNDGSNVNLSSGKVFSVSMAVGDVSPFALGTSGDRWPTLDIASVGLKAEITLASGATPPHTGRIWLEVVEYE